MATVLLFIMIPKGFFPVQDTGVILGISEAPQTVSFTSMAERQQKLVDVVLQDPAVDNVSSFIGVDGTNTDAELGAHPDQSEAAGRAQDFGDGRDSATAEQSGER